VINTIKEIDKDHNGYVTKTELEDILKLKYPEHFENKDLIPIIKKFSSIQNRILIDYKGFRDWVRLSVKNLAP
jgi:Ca2+-binding EF-hand superfamily protein